MKKGIFYHYLFWIGLAIKLALLPVISSHYMTDLFVPFMDQVVQNPTGNPWDIVTGHSFPYGIGLFIPLWLFKSIFYFIFGATSLGSGPLSMVAMKLPLLIADFGLLWILKGMAGPRQVAVLVYYWLNPILIYISFIHGQLDVIPSFLAIYGIYLIVREKWVPSAIFLSLANVSKLHTIIVVPLLLAYIWNTHFVRQGIQRILQWLAVYLPLLILGLLPQLLSAQFTTEKFGSQEAFKIFSAKLNLADQKVMYLGLIAIFACLARLSLATRISKDGLFFGCACLFGVLIVVTPAMPGWYYWFFPFVALFYATHLLPLRSLWILSMVLYLSYFVPLDWMDLGSIDNSSTLSVLMGSTFSLLQLCMVGLLFSIWVFVIKREVPLERRSRPLMLGIAGNSGTGKDRMTHILEDLFGGAQLAIIEGDNYHKWERGNSQWMDYTHLDPKANFLDQMATHTKNLISGKYVFYPEYDHQTGRFTDSRVTFSHKNVIIQGLHTFYQKAMREQLDIKIFMAPEESLRVAWKVLRDTKERGHSLEKVLSSIKAREQDSFRHIEPQRQFADWVIECQIVQDEKSPSLPSDFKELVTAPPFQVVHTVWNDTPLSALALNLREHAGVETLISQKDGNMDQVQVRFKGQPEAKHIEFVALKSFSCLRHLSRSRTEPVWHDGQEGIYQLMALALIERKQITEALK